MKNNIPQVRQKKELSIADLHARIVRQSDNEERISYETLRAIANDEAANIPLPDVRISTLEMIAIALNATFDELIEIV